MPNPLNSKTGVNEFVERSSIREFNGEDVGGELTELRGLRGMAEGAEEGLEDPLTVRCHLPPLLERLRGECRVPPQHCGVEDGAQTHLMTERLRTPRKIRLYLIGCSRGHVLLVQALSPAPDSRGSRAVVRLDCGESQVEGEALQQGQLEAVDELHRQVLSSSPPVALDQSAHGKGPGLLG